MMAWFLQAQFAGSRSNRWSVSADMAVPRASACSVGLSDGRLLVIGGSGATGVLNSVELYGTDGSVSPAAPMEQARANASCTLLADGRVLVTGGSNAGGALNSAEIYTPDTDAWKSAGAMALPRSGHTATRTPWGSVLVVGGEDSGTAEAFLANDTFVTLGRLSSPRTDYAVAVLPDKKILIAGGAAGSIAVAAIDIYDAANGTINPAGRMLTARRSFAAATLYDGTVMFIGGYDENGNALATTEIFDPAQGVSVAGPAMAQARAGHQAYTLPNNGKVLIVGGTNGNSPLATTEIYSPTTGKLALTGSMHNSRTSMAGAVARRGGIFVAGGKSENGVLPGAEIYNFATVESDKIDYAPGEVAHLNGQGWKPGEQVLLIAAAFPLDQHRAEFTAVAQADGNGQVEFAGFPMDRGHLGQRFLATATGSESQAQTLFANALSTPGFNVTMSPANPTVGTTVTITLRIPTVGGIPPTGQAQLRVDHFPGLGGAKNLDVTGQVFFTYSKLTVGSVVIGVDYTGDSNYGQILDKFDAAGNANLVFRLAVAAGAFTTTPASPIAYNTPTTAHAVFSPAASGPALTGTVTFSDGATAIGSPTNVASAGNTDFVLPASVIQSVATHTLTAQYSGDSNYVPLASPVITLVVNKATPILGITLPPGTLFAGSSQPFTSTVTSTAGTPTGTLTFSSGATALGAVTLPITTLTATLPQLPLGVNPITVAYSGDSNFAAVSDLTHTITVGNRPAPTGTLVSNTAAPFNFGTSIILNANFKDPLVTPTGTVNFFDGTTQLNGTSLVLTASGALFTVVMPAPGTHSFTAVYSGDGNFSGVTTLALPLTIGPEATTTSLTASTASPVTGVIVTYTVKVTPAPSGPVNPSGSVSVIDADTATKLCTFNLTGSGNCNVTYSGTPLETGVGNHNVKAVYTSNQAAIWTDSASGSMLITVTKATPAPPPPTTPGNLSVTLFANVYNPTVGQPINYTLVLNNGGNSGGGNSGTVQLFDNGKVVGSTILANGAAAFTISLSRGAHIITATYSDGSATYTATLTPSVVGNSPNVVIKGSSFIPVFGQVVALTVQVGGQGPAGIPPPTGQVNIFDGITLVGTSTLTAGVATLQSNVLHAGLRQLSATYTGDNNWSALPSGGIVQVVNQASTLTTATVLPDVSGISGVGTLSATVGVVVPGAGVPAGSVQFVDATSGELIATAPVTGGAAQIQVPLTSTAARAIRAIYSGTPDLVGSNTGSVPQLAIFNAAEFVSPHFAADEIVTIFGSSLSGSTAAAGSSLPTTLAGASVKIIDSAGVERLAQLFFASPTQINLLVPPNIAAGTATVTVTTDSGGSYSIVTTTSNAGPGIFSANSNGKGVAAAQIVRARADGTQALENVAAFDTGQQTLIASPIDLGTAADNLFLILYGTGLRHNPGVNSVKVIINGQSVPVLFSGAQPIFSGLDQINVGPLPASLRGSGTVNVQAIFNDVQVSNTVTLTFK